MRIIFHIVIFLSVSAFASTVAHAGCSHSGGSHFPGMKEISAGLGLYGVEKCSVSRRPCGHCSVTSMSIVRSPRHGKLVSRGLRAVYIRKSGFTGSDSFTLRWCETPVAEKGCYLAHYSVDVR
jgi:hypothetical protein